ncbi:MAG: cytochrome c3 family protein [Proteobacteria bacterium]|nr:cytochrome c3 family protein [Pseudomonadota bacterium]MBU1688814.1 cytochrome c3 family protein [Pseudomonadota bacterium]
MSISVQRSSGFLYPRIFIALIMLATLPTMAAPYAKQTPAAENCLSCHKTYWEKELQKKIIHQPFKEQKCLFCHAAPLTPIPDPDEPNQYSENTIRWIGRFRSPATSHWFEFKTDTRPTTLIIEANDNRINRISREVPLPVLSTLTKPPGFSTPPRIFDVKLHTLSSGLLPTVTISWQTDRPTNAVIYYGNKQLSLTSTFSHRYSTDHLATITCARSCLNFKYKIIAEDISGQRTTSDLYPLSLPTDDEFAREEYSGSDRTSNSVKLEIEQAMFRRGNNYLINVTANRPVLIALGIQQSKDDAPLTVSQSPEVIKHILTNNEIITNIRICYRCHENFKKRFPHPVNVYPKRGMVVSPNYRTLSDGRIACTSCHEPHTSNYPFRTVANPAKELCLGCHTAK